MQRQRSKLAGFAWLELLLALAAIALFFQMFPSAWSRLFQMFGAIFRGVVWAVDFRGWSRSVWFIVNVVMVLSLIGIRYGPEMKESWKEQREASALSRCKETEKLERAKKRKESREMRERYQEKHRRY